ncbi:MAG TPA: cyclic nucleotide-binding domain-containing protein [Albitalea sp.]|nr:cyclic nucleotide-binding domain-containing protein [Albitalea sp.]
MAIAELVTQANTQLHAALATPADIIAVGAGIIGVALVVTSSFVKTMIPLRWLAVGSNVGFLIYSVVHPSFVIMLMHGTLLPINVWRAVEMVRLTRRVTAAAAAGDLSGVWLKPYMRRTRLKAGSVLFRRGDIADHLYFLADGEMEFVEIGQSLEPGCMFGEIAFFTPDRRRTLTARCRTDCTVLSVDESTFRQLYFQNPDFGFQVVSLVAARLLADRQRLEQLLGKAPVS